MFSLSFIILSLRETSHVLPELYHIVTPRSIRCSPWDLSYCRSEKHHMFSLTFIILSLREASDVLPEIYHLSNRRINLGAKTPVTSFHRRVGAPSGPGAFRAPILPTASANSSSVTLDSGLQLPAVGVPAPAHWWTCYFPRQSLPGTGCRESPLGTGDPCSPLWEAPMDEVYSVPSYKGAPRGRRRGWPEALPTPASSPPWWLAAGASTLRGRPHAGEPPWLRPLAVYGGIWCNGAEHGCTPRRD